MQCPSCDAPNDGDARFCQECGQALNVRCASCGTEVVATAKFCKECGSALGARAGQPPTEDRAARKTVTVLFADLGGSTTFEEQVDPETARAVMARYHETARAIAVERGAGLIKFAGDGVMAVWGVPETGPDDAIGAVDAAVAMQDSFGAIAADVHARFDASVTLRVAINSGEIVVGDTDADLVGDAINVAARLEKECPTGQVVVGGDTWRAARGDYDFEALGQVSVKGRAAPVEVFLLTGATTDAAATPFVGREAELATLREALDAVVEAQNARLVTIIGEPGVGKTRLAREFGASVEIPMVEFTCEADSGVALGPIADVLRTVTADGTGDLQRLVGLDVADRSRILGVLDDLVSGGSEHSVEETFWGLRRLVEVTAATQPLILLFDDIQWADPLLHDLLEHLVEWVTAAPVLLIGLARPEIRETFPSLAGVGRMVDTSIALHGLNESATAALAAALLETDTAPRELVSRIPDSTRGNPLFVRELVRMLVHDGVLEPDGDIWHLTIDVDAIEIPPTVHSLLATRIERLEPKDRRVLEVASVVGTDFDLGAIGALAATSRASVLATSERLRRLQLLEPAGAYAGDDPVWRFHHVLIRDVAYRRLLKRDRAELHERLADHLDDQDTGAADVDEPVARHLDAAHRYRLELGDPSARLGTRAAERYLRAARRALDRDELTAAAALASSGVDLAGDAPALGAELAVLGCEALLALQDASAADRMVQRLAEVSDASLQPWLVCFAAELSILTDPDGLPQAEADLTHAIQQFLSADNQRGLAKAHLVRAVTRSRLGRMAECEADLDSALVAARAADDRRRVTSVLRAAPLAALWGPSSVPRAGGRCLDVIRLQRITTAAPSVEATSMRCQAVLEALRGRLDNARSMIATAGKTVAELGLRHGQFETKLFEGVIETFAGQHEVAEPHFRQALDGFQELAAGVDAGQAAALLAKCLIAQGRFDEADGFAAEAEKLAGQSPKTAIAWRSARAEILAERGQLDEAISLAIEAVDVGAGTDIVLDHAEAYLSLARVRDAAGDPARARDARGRARDLLSAKGAVAATSGPNQAPRPNRPRSSDRSHRLAIDNLAIQNATRLADAWNRRDLDAALSRLEPDARSESRRSVVSSGETSSADAIRSLFDVFTRIRIEPIAVRGNRLVLSEAAFTDEAGSQLQMLTVTELSERGLVRRTTVFDPEDFSDALLELDRQYFSSDESDNAGNYAIWTDALEALLARDWDRYAAAWADDCVFTLNHIGLPDMTGREYVDFETSLVEDAEHHLLWCSVFESLTPTISIARTHRDLVGLDGATSHWDFVNVAVTEGGKYRSVTMFPPEEIDAACALAEQLAQRTGRLAVENDCTRKSQQTTRLWNLGARDELQACTEPDLIVDSRRTLSSGPIDADLMRESLIDVFPRREVEPLSVLGSRLALERLRYEDAAGAELHALCVGEVSERGLTRALVTFDPDDLAGALDELNARYLAGEGREHAEKNRAFAAIPAMNRQDWNGMRAGFSEDFVARLHGSPVPTQDLDACIEFERSLARGASSYRFWTSALEWVSPTVCLAQVHREVIGADSSLARWDPVNVIVYRDGLIESLDSFLPAHRDAAFALADELSARSQVPPITNLATRTSDLLAALTGGMNSGRKSADELVARYEPDLLRESRRALDADAASGRADELAANVGRLAIRNAATRAAQRSADFWNNGDMERVLGNWERDGVLISRRRVTSSGDAEPAVALPPLLEIFPRCELDFLAVRGDRLMLAGFLLSDQSNSTLEMLTVQEVSERGLLRRVVAFDAEDLADALDLLDEWYFAGEGVAYARSAAASRAMNATIRGDWDGYRAACTPQFRLIPHGRVLPTMNLEEFIAFERGDAEGSGEARWTRAIAWMSPEVAVTAHRRVQTSDEGREEVSDLVSVVQFRDGRVLTVHTFPVEQQAAAFQLAQQLADQGDGSADLLSVSNRSTRIGERQLDAWRSRDREAILATFEPDATSESRRKVVSYEATSPAEAVGSLFDVMPNNEAEFLAVRGERLQLGRSVFSDDGGSSSEVIVIAEISERGLIQHTVAFDPDDLREALLDLDRRYYAGEGADFADAGAVVTAFVDAFHCRDWSAARSLLSDDLAATVHAGFAAHLSPEEVVASARDVGDGLDDYRVVLQTIEWHAPGVALASIARQGSENGMAGNWDMILVLGVQDDKIRSLDIWRAPEYVREARSVAQQLAARRLPGRLEE